MRIREILSEKNMKAKELADACGLSEMGMSNIMTGKSQPTAKTIVKIAKALGVPCGYLFEDYEAFATKTIEIQETTLKCPKCGYHMKLKAE